MTINGMFRALIPGINIFSPPPSAPFMHRKHVGHINARVRLSEASNLLLLDQRINLSIGGACFNPSKTVSSVSDLRIFPCVLLFLD